MTTALQAEQSTMSDVAEEFRVTRVRALRGPNYWRLAPVVACDHERAALDAAAASARGNGVELELVRVDLRREAPPHASTVTANLTAPLLCEVAARSEEPPMRIVCSGMLRPEVDEVAEAFARRGLAERERRSSGDWAALFLA